MMAGSQDVNKTRPGGTRVDPFAGPTWVIFFRAQRSNAFLHACDGALDRTLTINTAAGGNTTLLSLEEGDVL